MTPHERYLTYMHNQTHGAPMCMNCRCYVQHFRIAGVNEKGEMAFSPVHTGHCTEPRIKTRMPFDVCTRYEPKEE